MLHGVEVVAVTCYATGRVVSWVRPYLLVLHANPLKYEIMACLTRKLVQPDCLTRLHYCPTEKVVVRKPKSLDSVRTVGLITCRA